MTTWGSMIVLCLALGLALCLVIAGAVWVSGAVIDFVRTIRRHE
jgi:ABC-type nickel/cobalt efflux system permease component RcnA